MPNLDEFVRQANLTLSLYEETKSNKEILIEIKKLKRDSDSYLHALQELKKIEKSTKENEMKKSTKDHSKNYLISLLRANLLGE